MSTVPGHDDPAATLALPAPFDRLRSPLPDPCWPVFLSQPGAQALAMQFLLEYSGRCAPDALRALQLAQAGELVRHAAAHSRFYAAKFAAAGCNPEAAAEAGGYRALPIVTRAELQSASADWPCRRVPDGHDPVLAAATAGTTGTPLAFQRSAITQRLWLAMTLRDHLWHRRDFGGRLALIRPGVAVARAPGWGAATDGAFRSGEVVALDSAADPIRQLAWLNVENPDYLLAQPGCLRELARLVLATGRRPKRLRELRTYGEPLGAGLRALLGRAFGVPVIDVYSNEEAGYLALQCPRHPHYHVVAEGVLLEVRDDSGRECRPGERGRVVITALGNYATPFIRYDTGDWAEVGVPCDCGSTLPVLRRILGRDRNRVWLPDGRHTWPNLPPDLWADLAPFRQLRIVQRSQRVVEVLYALERSLDARQRQTLVTRVQAALGHPFEVKLSPLPALPLPPGGRCEDFVCEVDSGVGVGAAAQRV